jgi:hypothetical protein
MSATLNVEVKSGSARASASSAFHNYHNECDGHHRLPSLIVQQSIPEWRQLRGLPVHQDGPRKPPQTNLQRSLTT